MPLKPYSIKNRRHMLYKCSLLYWRHMLSV